MKRLIIPLLLVLLLSAPLPGHAQDDGDRAALETITFNGISLSYPVDLGEIEARSVDGTEAEPPHTLFSFSTYHPVEGDAIDDNVPPPQVRVYETSSFPAYQPEEENVAGYVNEQMRLENLLVNRPSLSEPGLALPYLPLRDDNQTFIVEGDYLSFLGGRGLRYLTFYTLERTPPVEGQVFYTFQGLSNDARFYISATFPLLTNDLPAEVNLEDIGREDLPDFFRDLITSLERQDDDEYTPGLAVLDGVITSLAVSNEQTLVIAPYKLPCTEGRDLCPAVRPPDTEQFSPIAARSIEGLDYQWAIQTEARLRISPRTDEAAEGPPVGYELLDITSQSPVEAGSTFNLELDGYYLSQAEDGAFLLPDGKTFACVEAEACENLPETFNTPTRVSMLFEFGAEPAAPLRLLSWRVPDVQAGINFADTAWQVELLGGVPLLVEAELTLQIEDGQASGSAGCNTFTAEVRTGNEQFILREIAVTEIACESEGLMAQEERYLSALDAAARYLYEDNRLTLFNRQGEDLLTLRLDTGEEETDDPGDEAAPDDATSSEGDAGADEEGEPVSD
jgi:heat shock protein HslJ